MKRLLAVLLILCLIPVVSLADLRDLQEALFPRYLDLYYAPTDFSLTRSDMLTVIKSPDYTITLRYGDDGEVAFAQYVSAKPLDYDFVGYVYCMIQSFFSKEYIPAFGTALARFHGGNQQSTGYTEDYTGVVLIMLTSDGYPCVLVKSGLVIE